MRAIDLSGQRFGSLVAVCIAEKNGGIRWKCKCDCGREHVALSSNLRSGAVKSCGCKRILKKTHGMGNTAVDVLTAKQMKCQKRLLSGIIRRSAHWK